MSNTPHYYQLQTGDLYDLFVDHRGLEVVRQHLEMAVLEYLWRCRHKGQYLRDLEKARVILDRLIDMADHNQPPVPANSAYDEWAAPLAKAREGWYPVEVPHE